MVDLDTVVSSTTLNFYSDASANASLGVGAVFNMHWLFAKWEPLYISKNKPSIEYLELFGVTAALLMWGDKLKDQRISIYCDNMAVVNMINNYASSCHNCMYLLRLIALDNLTHNRRVFTLYVRSTDNSLADSLSRLQFKCFWRLAPVNMDMDKYPTKIAAAVWPASKLWSKHQITHR